MDCKMNTKITACLITILALSLLQGCARALPKKKNIKKLMLHKVILVEQSHSTAAVFKRS